MAEPNWQLWESILQDLRSDTAALRSDVSSVKATLDGVEREVKGLKTMSQMALGTASGADFVAERAQKMAEDTNKRLDGLIAALKRKEIDVDA